MPQAAIVIAAVRSAERVDALAGEITASGGRATAVRCDATQSAEVAALFVYNAGNCASARCSR